ncbi:XdhC family protein [Flavobacteriales bacterium]|nr:XdhC family protein [Flavobacteriales bacterium]
MDAEFWKQVIREIESSGSLALLYVVESRGSSPGRQGFKLWVSEHKISGTIGGGFMEHKLVELAKSKLQNGKFNPFIKRQVHQSNSTKDRSGMICSGEQTIAFIYLDKGDLAELRKVFTSNIIQLSEKGLMFCDVELLGQFKFDLDVWQYQEQIDFKNKLYIIGGGHVSLALSKLMADLGFEITVLDNRSDLNTMVVNNWVIAKKVINYDSIGEYIPEGENIYIVLVSFGFRTDKLCLERLMGKSVKYFGVMGSKAKMNQLLLELEKEGKDKEQLARLYTPIGVPIHSQTTTEIAISIAAEIIQVKNGA